MKIISYRLYCIGKKYLWYVEKFFEKDLVRTIIINLKYNRAPIYTFAEDYVMGAANIILTSGNRVYASKYWWKPINIYYFR